MRSLLVALALLPVSAFSQTSTPTPFSYSYDQLKKDLGRYIQDQMGKENVRGLSLALVDGGEVVWCEGFGWADDKTKATADTRYALGGLSRVFTAAEVLRLAEKGRLGLDDPLSRHIPGFSIQSRFKKTKPITPRALLAGHSGLPGFFLKGLWVEEPESLADLVEDLKEDHLYDPPQTRYRYSYTDSSLLGRMVELKRKKPFAEALRQDLFEPLGMTASAFEAPMPGGTTARGGLRSEILQKNRLRDVPAAGMVSSAADLAKFLTFLNGAPVSGKPPLSSRSIQALFKSQYPGRPIDFGHEMGLGWNLSGFPVAGRETAWCDGTYPGYFASAALLREEGLGVVILSNSMEAGKIADGLAQRALKLALQVKEGEPQDLTVKKIEMPKTIEVPHETLEGYAGLYSALGQVAPITAKEKVLGIGFQGHDLELLPVAPATFIPHLVFLIFPVDLPQYPLSFTKAGGKEVALLGGFHFPIPLQKITAVPIPEAWKEREGDYLVENPDPQVEFSKVSLLEKDGFLTVEMRLSFPVLGLKDKDFKIALMGVSDEEAVVPGLFYGDGGTLRVLNEGNGGTEVYYSGYRFKRLEAPTPVVRPAATWAPTTVPVGKTPEPSITPAQVAPKPGATPAPKAR